MVVLVGLVAFGAKAVPTTDWVPSGSMTMMVQTKNIHPTISFDKYDKPQAMVDGWLNLPQGFAAELIEYAGLNNADLDGDKGDEFDACLWKKIILPNSGYLKFRLKWCDGYPVGTGNGNDVLAYDVFLGRKWKCDERNAVGAEIRVEYWNYVRDANNGMVSIIPSVTHEYRLGEAVGFLAYDRLSLQWNNEMAPFSELLSGQAQCGIKIPLSKSLQWNAVDVTGVIPLGDAGPKDPRQGGVISIAMAVTGNF